MNRKKDLRNAQMVFNFFKHETDCLNKRGELVVVPRYVVAIGDDPISAYYACKIAHKAERQMGIVPRIICCGGYYQFSRRLNVRENGRPLTEGQKMARICQQLCPECKTIVLDRSCNIVQSVSEVAKYLASNKEENRQIIFCPTQRLSKRLQRIADFSGWYNMIPLKARYYVHGERIPEIMQAYNGMKFAGGTLLLNEAANLYLRMTDPYHIARYMEPLDCDIPQGIHEAGLQLAAKYPLRHQGSCAANPLQGGWLLWCWYWHRKQIQRDLQKQIRHWQKNL